MSEIPLTLSRPPKAEIQKDPPVMMKKLAVIGVATSIAFAPVVLAPMAAIAQTALPADLTGHPYQGPVVSGGRPNLTPTARPAITAKPKKHPKKVTKHTKPKPKAKMTPAM
jgi:hypothetical protein